MNSQTITVGLLFIGMGILFLLGKYLPIGRLPGDITLRGRGFSLFFPITSCLLGSIFLALILRLFRRG